MPTAIKKIGVLTGGGDAPGLNAVIRAVVKAGCNAGLEVIGIEDSFDGLLEFNRMRVLTTRDVTGILRRGGTILGTVNTGDPFVKEVVRSDGTQQRYADRVVEMFHKMGLGGLVVIGGDGTLGLAHRFIQLGIPIIGVPKTIDNDIVGTTNCFGFDTAVAFATDALDRLHTTAEAHRRVMVVEVMGRYAGWIALYAGLGGGADAILMPEIPYDVNVVAKSIKERDEFGAHFSIIVVAEGARPRDGDVSLIQERGGRTCRTSRRRRPSCCAGARIADGEGDTNRRARSPATRRIPDELRSRPRDTVWRQGCRTTPRRRLRQDGRVSTAQHRRRAAHRHRRQDPPGPARHRHRAHRASDGHLVWRLTTEFGVRSAELEFGTRIRCGFSSAPHSEFRIELVSE